LIDRYADAGAIGDHSVLKRRDEFAKKIENDPIAVACCRILNDFRPLDRIVDSIVSDAGGPALDRYLGAALAQHCFYGGVRYEILIKAFGSTVKSQRTPTPFFASKNDPSDGAETGAAEPHIAEQSRSWRSASGEREVKRGS
jgi:hypothetical protein